MFDVIFYKDKNGKSEIIEYLDRLKAESSTDKNLRINRKKILAYISVLCEYGTRIGEPIVKYIDGDIWELRHYLIGYFSFTGRIILLYYFITI